MAEQGLNDINAVLGSDAHIAPDLSAKIYNPSKAQQSTQRSDEEEIAIADAIIAAEPTTANIAYHDSLADKDMDATITRGEVSELKTQINDSFSEVANLVLDLMNRFDLLDQRIVNFNARGGHKL